VRAVAGKCPTKATCEVHLDYTRRKTDTVLADIEDGTSLCKLAEASETYKQ
jgi:hypothetical protein